MKKMLFFAIILLPPPISAMQKQHEKDEKEYYEHAMGSLVLVKETQMESGGSQIEGKFRKGDTVKCLASSDGKVDIKITTPDGSTIEPEAFGEDPNKLYDSLKRK